MHVRSTGLCVYLKSIPCSFEIHHLETEKKNVFTDLAALRHSLRHHTHKSSTSFNSSLPVMKIQHLLPTVTQPIDLGKLSLHSLLFSQHPLGVTLRLKLKRNNRRVWAYAARPSCDNKLSSRFLPFLPFVSGK